MKIFNSLTRKKEEFVPIRENHVSMYVCGPTVYNLIHIGNARPMIVFDTFRRYMEYRGYTVDYVSNFTDVDDKIINRAREGGVSSSEISEKYIAECKKDMEGMNVRPATVHPKATEEIDGMIGLIDDLIEKEYAYVTEDGTVYFRTRKDHDYGKLSHKNIDDLEAGHGRELKVAGNDGKEDYLDFVLWKPKKEGEPFWHSPWCDGRPGWHTECCVMAKKYLGPTIDIHAGGEDLIFPHHENEIAQSEAANGVPFAHYWMHNGFLNVDNVKMSKSLGNFRLVREIADQYDLQAVRLFMLSAQYRSPLNFSGELLEAAAVSLERIRTAVSNLDFLLSNAAPVEQGSGEMTEEEREKAEAAKAFSEKFNAAMDDDLNTADALAAVFELVKFSNSNTDEKSSAAFLSFLRQEIVKLCDVLGLIVVPEKEELLDSEIEALIAERQEARKQKNFKRADEIREELAQKGILLEDTRQGVKWKRAN